MSNNHLQPPNNSHEDSSQITTISDISCLKILTLADLEPFCIGTGTTPRVHLQCRYYRFPNEDSFETWLDDRKQVVHWICRQKKPHKNSAFLEYREYECNFAGRYTQTSANHINTTNDLQQQQQQNGDGTNETTPVPIKKRKRKPTIKINCPAKIQMKITPKDPDGIYVTWIYKHNHDVGTEEYFNLSREKKNAKRKSKKRKR